jgi:hypothetical protein
MEHFAGLDVSVKETSVCIVDDSSRLMVLSLTIAAIVGPFRSVIQPLHLGAPHT